MQTRYGQSPWIAADPAATRPSSPRLRGEHDADVVIVGGGLTGCATALACATGGHETAGPRGRARGPGLAGHSSGLLLPDPGRSFRDVAQARTGCARPSSSSRRGGGRRSTPRRSCGGWAIRCGLEPRDSLLVGAGRTTEKELLREYDAREAAGVSVAWLTRRQVTARDAARRAGGDARARRLSCSIPTAPASGWPRGRRRAARASSSDAAVKKVRVGRKHVEIVVDGGLVKAAHGDRGHRHAPRRSSGRCGATSRRARSISCSPSRCPRRCASRSATAA